MDELSKDYTKFLETGELSDTEILVGSEPETKIYRLHSLILKIRSPYFRTALSSNWVKIENNIIKFQKENISVQVFDIIVKYIYTNKLELVNDVKTNVELLIAADELCLDELCFNVEKYLLKNKKLLKSNFILISHVASRFNQFKNLSQFYENSFKHDSSIIFKANDFVTIKQEALLDVIKRNHSLKPIEVWDKLMEWAISRSNELQSDITIWTADNISTFGTLIQQFIPHINFKGIGPSDFFQKIRPLKGIFNDDSYLEIVEHYAFNNDNNAIQRKDSYDNSFPRKSTNTDFDDENMSDQREDLYWKLTRKERGQLEERTDNFSLDLESADNMSSESDDEFISDKKVKKKNRKSYRLSVQDLYVNIHQKFKKQATI